jgi:multidrug efflux pump subunit AcrB
MFKPMALTVILALVGALILSLTLMPVLCSLFLGGSIREQDSFLDPVGEARVRPDPALRPSVPLAGGRRARWRSLCGRSPSSRNWGRSSCPSWTKDRSPPT